MTWEMTTENSLKVKIKSYSSKERSELKIRFILRAIRKLPKLENTLNVQDVTSFKYSIENFIEELPCNPYDMEEHREKAKNIKKCMLETFYLEERDHYKKELIKIGLLISPFAAFLFPDYLLGYAIMFLTCASIGTLLDFINYKKGIAI